MRYLKCRQWPNGGQSCSRLVSSGRWRWRKISIDLALMKWACGWSAAALLLDSSSKFESLKQPSPFSTTMAGTPRRPKRAARVSPLGPPPTTATAVFATLLIIVPAAMVAAGLSPLCKQAGPYKTRLALNCKQPCSESPSCVVGARERQKQQ